MDVRSGRDYKHLEEGDIPVYGTGGYMLSVNEALSSDEDAIGIGRKGTIDNPYILRAPFWTVDTLFYAVPREKYDLDFMYSIFQNVNWKAKDESTGVPSLSKTTINAVTTMAPVFEEQVKIGKYFSNIDNLITLHQRNNYQKNIKSAHVWEQRKLGKISDSYSGGTPTAGKKEYYDGNIPFIRSGEISSDKTELFITEEGLNSSSAKMVSEGDILYALYGATSGEVSISRLKGAINQAILAIQPHEGYDSQFIMQWLRKSKESIISTYLQGGQGNLSGNIVKELLIDLPTYDEQRQIGRYFKKIDNLITLHQWKHILLSFGIENDWEQRKVSDLLVERNNQAPMSDEYPLMAFIANQGVAPKGDRYDRSALVNDETGKKYKRTEFGDFIYSSNNLEAGSIGLNKYGNACISPVYSIFKPTGVADLDFLGRRFLRKDFINEMVKWRQGVVYGQWKIHESDFVKIEIAIPSKEEQMKIGRYLDSLDKLITLHQWKSNEWNNKAVFTWEQRKLLDNIQKITDFRGRTPKKLGMDWSEEGYLALSALNVKDGYIDFFQDVHYGNQELYDKWMTGNELHKGQVLFTTEAPMGNVAQVPDNRQYILSQRTIAFDVFTDKMTEDFLATVLRSPNVFNDLTALSSGGTAKGVSQKSLSSLEIIVPNEIEEQECIAKYFKTLDSLITLHHRKLFWLKKAVKIIIFVIKIVKEILEWLN